MDNEIKSELDQPMPTKNDKDALWPKVAIDVAYCDWNAAISIQDRVIHDMHERHEVGLKRYGTALQPFNGRNALVDAYQEVLDTCVYLKQAIVEMNTESEKAKFNEDVYEDLWEMYMNTIQQAMTLRSIIGK